jgi:hypothetical protein
MPAFPSALGEVTTKHIEDLIATSNTWKLRPNFASFAKSTDLARNLRAVANNVERPVALNLAKIVVSRI